MKNKYVVDGDITTIFLKRRTGEIIKTCIDTDDLDKVKDLNLSWYSVFMDGTQSYYARATQYCGMIEGKPKYKMIYLHRVILETEDKVDHKNHDTLDNRKHNLRKTNKTQNSMNKNGLSKHNTSGYRNVSYIKNRNKYIVQLQVNGRNKLLGEFEDVHEAGSFAEQMRNKYYGEYAGKG